MFVYPLRAHRKQMKQFGEDSVISLSPTHFLESIKRAVVGATIGITTDILGSIAAIALPEDLPIFLLSVIYELDISLNIFCLSYTYKVWKDIVFPCKTTKENRQEMELA